MADPGLTDAIKPVDKIGIGKCAIELGGNTLPKLRAQPLVGIEQQDAVVFRPLDQAASLLVESAEFMLLNARAN